MRDLLVRKLGALGHPTFLRKEFIQDKGFVTVELAMGLPAVLLITYMCIWGISVASLNLRLHAATSNTARVLARGDVLSSSYLSTLPTGTTLSTAKTLDRLTVTLSAPAPSLTGPLKFPALTLTSATVVRDETYVAP